MEEPNREDLEFLSAQEEEQEEERQEENDLAGSSHQGNSVDVELPVPGACSSPFQSSCSPIRGKDGPTSSGGQQQRGSVRAMVQAMERRSHRQSSSPLATSLIVSSPSPGRVTAKAKTKTTASSKDHDTEHVHRRASSTTWYKTHEKSCSDGWKTEEEGRKKECEPTTNHTNQTAPSTEDDGYATSYTATDDEEYELVEEGGKTRSHRHTPLENQRPKNISASVINTNRVDSQEAHFKTQSHKPSKKGDPLQVATNIPDEFSKPPIADRRSTTPCAATRPILSEGTIIQVQSRTWPGINQPGGVATVLKAHTNEAGFMSYDVQYVLDRRKEKQVHSEFVHIYEDLMKASTTTISDGSRCHSPRTSQSPSTRVLSSDPFKLNSNTKPRSSLKKPPSRIKKRKSSDKQDISKRQKSPKFVATTIVKSLDKMTMDELCEAANEWYRRRICAALDEGILYVCGSGLDDVADKALKDLARMTNELNVRIVIQPNIHATKTTMCLVPINEPLSTRRRNVTAVLRTMKTMQSAILGIPIVNTSWIFNSKRNKHVSEPDSCLFVRSLPTKRTDDVANFGVAYLAAAASASSPGFKYSPFVDMSFFFCGFIQKDEDNFHKLLCLAGVDKFLNKATLLSSVKEQVSKHPMGQTYYKFVVLCGASATIAISKAVQEVIEQPDACVAVVASQWLVDSVSAGKPLSASNYPPLASSAKARQLWEGTKDKSFSIESS